MEEDDLELKMLMPPILKCWDHSLCHSAPQDGLFNNAKFQQARKV